MKYVKHLRGFSPLAKLEGYGFLPIIPGTFYVAFPSAMQPKHLPDATTRKECGFKSHIPL